MIEKEHQCDGAGGFSLIKLPDRDGWVIDDGENVDIGVDYCPWCGIKLNV